MKLSQYTGKEYLDDIVYTALRKGKKVTLFLCRDDDECGFGIKIDNSVIARNIPWEVIETQLMDAWPEKEFKK